MGIVVSFCQRSLLRDRCGVALIIVLSFIVLLAATVVAFLSSSVVDRQVANSSANQAKADLFIQGAIDVVVGDLKQEIAAGSTLISPAAGVTIYTPTAPANSVPALAGVTGATGLENLLKRSASNTPFYPTGLTYDTAAYPPSRRASTASTLSPSKNGRFISPARWNKALLLAKANLISDTDFTPVGATAATASTAASWANAPDWILVSRNGTNPTAWNSNLKHARDSATSVIGRYAYAIYDEGGLIDMNVAGYPTLPDIAKDITRKSSLAFADLTQLPGLASLTTAQQEKFLNSIVGWRNYVTVGVTSGTLAPLSDPATGYTIDSGTNYRNFVLSNTTGFLTTGNSALSGGNSDRLFGSRQQMMSFLLQGIGAGTSASAIEIRAKLQNALQFMGTFSRDLNQPSLAPNPDRPKILSNTAADNFAGNDAAGGDDLINPSFLTMRVAATFARNDGTQAKAGEPLVKKRFALNRLAWLTYQGPSASRNTSDPDIQALLTPGTGITASFLEQGTAQNIEKYFGLTWNNAGYWSYTHNGGSGNVLPLTDVIAADREANFIELLKAGINAGAIAKGSTKPAGTAGGSVDEGIYFDRDTSLDYAILQTAVNIIDQFDADGFPVRLRFTSNGKLMEFRGVENLPYFYRIRNATILAGLPNPLTGTDPLAAPLVSTGLYVSMYQPEIWNPHDRNSSLGNPRPTELRFVADGAFLDADGNADPALYNTNHSITKDLPQANPLNSASPGYAALYDIVQTPKTFLPLEGGGGAISKFTADSTEMNFTDNSGSLFREPTLLTRPGIPIGSNLRTGSNHALRTIFTDSRVSAYRMNVGTPTEGIQCYTNPLSIGTATPYIGLYRSAGPLRWVTSGTNITAGGYVSYTTANSGSVAETCRMQYKATNGDWMTYDEKITPAAGLLAFASNGISIKDTPETTYSDLTNTSVGYKSWASANDPRTSRFGILNSSGRGDILAGRPGISETVKIWIDQANNVLSSNRPAAASGMGGYDDTNSRSSSLPYVGGWYPNPVSTWRKDIASFYFRYGLLSQNDPLAVSNGPIGGGTDNLSGAAAAQYYTDPDGVVRRAMGAYVPTGMNTPASTAFGLPMASATGPNIFANQSQSRPIILNRPFRSVAELGHVFSDTPWKNLSFFTPESGDSGLLDVFCIQETGREDAMVAGKVNLNTRQSPVLKAILAGSYADELNSAGTSTITAADADVLATALVARTTGTAAGQGPLANVSELVGRWNSSVDASQGGIDGGQSYTGFTADLSTVFTATAPAAAAVAVPEAVAMRNIQRFREAPVRALSANGTARVWNLMIDIVAQTGRYPASATSPENFSVEGEKRLWVHIAIDRYTGKVIDRVVEVVTE